MPRQYAAQIAKYTEKQLQPGRRNRGHCDNGRRRLRLTRARLRGSTWDRLRELKRRYDPDNHCASTTTSVKEYCLYRPGP